MNSKLIAKNRKAFFDYTILEKFTTGIVLKGFEVKAIKEGKVSFEGSYVEIVENEAFVTGMYIGRYSRQSKDFVEADAKRRRKLLLNKNEILKIKRETDQKGKTAVPLAIVLNRGLVKLEIAVVKGKKEYDKKETAKEKQGKKDLEIETKKIKSIWM